LPLPAPLPPVAEDVIEVVNGVAELVGELAIAKREGGGARGGAHLGPISPYPLGSGYG